MNSIDIQTGQHVTIAYKPANAFERGVATFLDWTIQFLYIMAVMVFFDNMGFGYYDDWFSYTVLLIFAAPVAFYNILFEGLLLYGQTPGKMAMKLKVTTADGSAVSISSHFLRWLIRPIDFFPFLGIAGMFIMLYTKKGQRIGDLAADTVVVKTSAKIDIGIEYYDFDENYNPVYPQAGDLSVLQAEMIMRYLDLSPKHYEEKIAEFVDKVKKVLEIEDYRTPSREILRQVMKDYNYCTSLGL